MYKIVCDSACDMHEMGDIPFAAVPLKISTDTESWTDNKDMDIHHMLDTLEHYTGRSFTACPNIDEWMQAFEGADEIYAITITSGLSGSYNSAMSAKDIYLETHPNVKIHVFDSLSTSTSLRMIAEKIAELKTENPDISFEEVVVKVSDYFKHTHMFYTLHSLHNLAQNGRVSKVVAAAVSVIGLRIFGTTTFDGKLDPITKVRGDKKNLNEYMNHLEEIKTPGKKFRIAHVENPEFAENLKKKILEKYPGADVVIGTAGGLDSFYGERGCIFLACEDGL